MPIWCMPFSQKSAGDSSAVSTIRLHFSPRSQRRQLERQRLPISIEHDVKIVTATRAIDRVLRGSYYWVPHWYKAEHNVAYWNKFSRPAKSAKYDPGVLDTWWYDKAKADALAKPAPTGGK